MADGRIVVVEKPFVPTHKEAEELVGFAQKHNKLLAVYQSTSSICLSHKWKEC